MARRPAPPVSYGEDLELPGASPSPETHSLPPAGAGADAEDRPGRRPILDKSAPTLLYLHPTGKHQLRQYAVAHGLKTKVHDLLIEAMEEWGAKRGLAGPWRVEAAKPRR